MSRKLRSNVSSTKNDQGPDSRRPVKTIHNDARSAYYCRVCPTRHSVKTACLSVRLATRASLWLQQCSGEVGQGNSDFLGIGEPVRVSFFQDCLYRSACHVGVGPAHGLGPYLSRAKIAAVSVSGSFMVMLDVTVALPGRQGAESTRPSNRTEVRIQLAPPSSRVRTSAISSGLQLLFLRHGCGMHEPEGGKRKTGNTTTVPGRQGNAVFRFSDLDR
jgi:hypothetical protein